MVVDDPLTSPDFHLPTKPGPPETRVSVDVCCTGLPSGPGTSVTTINEFPFRVNFDFETAFPFIRNASSHEVGLNSLPMTDTPLGIVYSLPARSKSVSKPPPL